MHLCIRQNSINAQAFIPPQLIKNINVSVPTANGGVSSSCSSLALHLICLKTVPSLDPITNSSKEISWDLTSNCVYSWLTHSYFLALPVRCLIERFRMVLCFKSCFPIQAIFPQIFCNVLEWVILFSLSCLHKLQQTYCPLSNECEHFVCFLARDFTAIFASFSSNAFMCFCFSTGLNVPAILVWKNGQYNSHPIVDAFVSLTRSGLFVIICFPF